MFNKFNEEVGLLKRGTITDIKWDQGYMLVQLTNNLSINGNKPIPKNIPLPHSLYYNNGMFIGAKPKVGTPVVVGQGVGGQYYFVSFLAENLDNVPDVDDDSILISLNEKTRILANQKNDITIGSSDHRIQTNTKSSFITTYFNNINNFSSGTRHVIGPIKRDLKPNTNFSQDVKLTDDIYSDKLFTIGLDPSAKTNNLLSGPNKNPALIESREIINEFLYSSDIQDEYNESILYNKNYTIKDDYTFPNRRKSRTDTLSLSLTSPNFLIETVKGTVVDIFGNILDLNRNPLPVGTNKATLRSDGKSPDKQDAYLQIRELQRKSIAYHFELNARKDLNTSNKITLPDINSNSNYSRNRSRFFFDVDKEGQFKINIPSSSEKGNVPLLTRYENYSTFGSEDNNNPNKLIFRNDNLDIFLDSFAAPKATLNNDGISFAEERGSIEILDDNSPATPIDRITNKHIKHGTAYHDILNSCFAHQTNDYLAYPTEWGKSNFPISDFPVLTVASSSIKISGPDANAGGRSGSLHMDGSFEWSIGANTVDRQSLWVDMAGGTVWNVGRDLRGNSAVMSMDGNVYWQVGGYGVSTDSRFSSEVNGYAGAVLDIRVLNSFGRATLIRVDNNGVSIMSPGNIAVHAGQNLKISADADIAIEAETVTIQGRGVLKELGGSI